MAHPQDATAPQLSNDLDVASAATREYLRRTHDLLIGGESVSSNGDGRLTVLDPSSGAEVATAADGTADDIDRAVRSARSALDEGDWKSLRPDERERLMLKLADLIEDQADVIAEIEAIESGRKVGDTRVVDAEFSAHILRYMAGWPSKIHGETLPASVPYMPGANFLTYTVREPIGVVGAITPWNVPMCIATWKVAPALAAGCTVVLKPAELTPLTALMLGELALEAGFPPGVLNVVTGGGPVAGEALVTHPGVDKISFTGSTAVGRRIGEIAGGLLKPVTLELGGKSPVVIMADADLEQAIPAAAWAIFANQGQNCCAGSRLYVEQSVFDEVVDGVVEIARSIRLGPSLDSRAEMGPLVSRAQQDRVDSLVRQGVSEGAEVRVGGSKPDHPGFYFEPTVLTDIQRDMCVVREEIFGPVLVAQPFRDLKEAVALANDHDYGLGASVFTRDLDVAHAFSRAVDAGSIWVNVHNVLDVGVPFSGFKQSGVGTDLGKESVLANTRLKANYLSLKSGLG
ncbi:aldehyde dehydrogenase family protein [Elongatibacter sediminis]|uniref:Aldehyde dehydrogenase family protein n=1 Tax=Elongatibacter sediminis TaxID=3119006 RepID=A0AAW9RBQ3_9GAMM